MDVTCVLIELKPESGQKVSDWAQYINEHKAAALETLAHENVTLENYFTAVIEGKPYLIGYMRARSLEKAHDVVKHSTAGIDAFHQAFKKETWKKVIKANMVLELNRTEDEEKWV